MPSVSHPDNSANVLLVDDTPANLQVLGGMLKEQECIVRPVPSGKLAIRFAEADPPDIILLDIMMPEMDGYEVCRRLKEIEGLRNIPVIFISALHETIDKVKAFAAGGVDYISKPFQFEEVQARVRTHLNIRRLQVELEHQNRQLSDLNQVLRKTQNALESELAHAAKYVLSLIPPLIRERERYRPTGSTFPRLGLAETRLATTGLMIHILPCICWTSPAMESVRLSCLSRSLIRSAVIVSQTRISGARIKCLRP